MIKLELDLDEAAIIHNALLHYDSTPVDLISHVSELIDSEEQLQNMDLDDCAGGACKL